MSCRIHIYSEVNHKQDDVELQQNAAYTAQKYSYSKMCAMAPLPSVQMTNNNSKCMKSLVLVCCCNSYRMDGNDYTEVLVNKHLVLEQSNEQEQLQRQNECYAALCGYKHKTEVHVSISISYLYWFVMSKTQLHVHTTHE